MSVNCLYITSGVCWKSTAQLAETSALSVTFSPFTSGRCGNCLSAMSKFGYTNNLIQLLHNNTELASGRRVQFLL